MNNEPNKKECIACQTKYPSEVEFCDVCDEELSWILQNSSESLVVQEADEGCIDLDDSLNEDEGTNSSSHDASLNYDNSFLFQELVAEDDIFDVEETSVSDTGFEDLSINSEENANDSTFVQEQEYKNVSNTDSSKLFKEQHIIPFKLQDQGYVYVNRLGSTNLVDDILIQGKRRRKYVLRVYRNATLSNEQALYMIQNDEDTRLEQFGYGLSNSFTRDWELIEHKKRTLNLRDLIQQNSGNEDFALEVAEALCQFINSFSSRLRFISLEPEFLEVTSKKDRDLEFDLDFFGALYAHDDIDAITKEHSVHIDALQNCSTISNIYRAPELLEGHLYSNSVMFSIASIVAEIYFGSFVYQSDINNANIAFHTIDNTTLRNFLMACLYPRSSQRWSLPEALKFFDTGHVAPVGKWASLKKNGTQYCFIVGTGTHQIECWSPQDLAAAITDETWDSCLVNIEGMLNWLEKTNQNALSKMYKKRLYREEITADYILINIKRHLLPSEPIFWRNLSLSDNDAAESLIALAQEAIAGDERAIERLTQLHEARLVTETKNAFVV